jgi:copper(I)-binding protein
MRRLVSRTVLSGTIVVAGLTVGGYLAAQGKPVSASNAWVKVPASGQTRTEAFVVIANPTMYDIFLTSATATVAGKVEFRDASKPGDARAQTVTDVRVPAYESLSMNPKGVQLVLMDLKEPLKEGDTVPLTLTTDGGDKLTVSAVVKKE